LNCCIAAQSGKIAINYCSGTPFFPIGWPTGMCTDALPVWPGAHHRPITGAAGEPVPQAGDSEQV
jgi:hypothetical protein